MYRKILIKGNNAKYVEKRGNGNVASDREITPSMKNLQAQQRRICPCTAPVSKELTSMSFLCVAAISTARPTGSAGCT